MKIQKLGYRPKKKPDLVSWMLKHNVSVFVCTPEKAVYRALYENSNV